jgi:hypothetical protein
MRVVDIPQTSVTSSKISAILNRNRYRDVISQYRIDTKQAEPSFTESAKRKMNMGTMMEPIIAQAAIDFFDQPLVVDKERYMHDENEFFRVEFDALDYKNHIVYEFKNTEQNEDTLYETYYPQVQLSMYVIGWDKARIVYLRNGWELGYVEVDRDENFIEHMITAGTYYYECLTTMTEPDPAYIDEIAGNINFYKEQDERQGIDVEAELTAEDVEKLYEWGKLKKQIQLLEIEDARFKGYFADKYGKFTDENINYSNAEYVRKGNIDLKKLKIDYPEINLEEYRQDDTKYQRQTLKYRANLEEEGVTINREEDLV